MKSTLYKAYAGALLGVLSFLPLAYGQRLPSLDTVHPAFFQLERQPFRIYSGSIHYFRVPAAYWYDRLLKLRDCGLNTVDTYVAWNLHEQTPGKFDFTGNLDIARFMQIANDLGLYVILRPGPYICAEWEWGGHPAWLLQDPSMKVRSLHIGYQKAVGKYFDRLIPVIERYQYSNGGPIIAVQVENEFGSYGSDIPYLQWLARILREKGIVEALFTSDGPGGFAAGSVPGEYAVVNAQSDMANALQSLREWQPNRPLMVGEFWTGWFDHWSENHNGWALQDFNREVINMLQAGASFNLFMFHGGTNFGFMNGGNQKFEEAVSKMRYQPTITSYDYDCLLDESGRQTQKYYSMQQLLRQHANFTHPVLRQVRPRRDITNVETISYGAQRVREYATLTDVLELIIPVSISRPDYMEFICWARSHEDFCENQNFGYIAYRKIFYPQPWRASVRQPVLRVEGEIADRAIIMVNGRTVQVVQKEFEGQKWSLSIPLPDSEVFDIIILVENMGRVNFATVPQRSRGFDLNRHMRRGFTGHVYLDDRELQGWYAYAVSMQADWMDVLSKTERMWRQYPPVNNQIVSQPAFYRSLLWIGSDLVKDTYLYMKNWNKGAAFINNVNIGRYWSIGPQQALYVPGVWLRQNANTVIVFEMHHANTDVVFQDFPVLNEKPVIQS